jgi:hypothetical protein
MSQVTQSNTQPGPLAIASDGDLTGKEGRLVTLGADGVKLPEAITDLVPYLLDEGGADEAMSTVIPFEPSRNLRVVAKGTGDKGDALVLAAIAGDDAGKLRVVPATAGTYNVVAVAEEDFADGQLVLVRPLVATESVPTAFTGATPADTAATSTTPFGYSEAQANALVANVREIRAVLIARGIMANNA